MHTFLASFVHRRGLITAMTCVSSLLVVLMLAHSDQPSARAAEPAATVISEDIAVDTTWTKAGSPYHVTRGIRVLQGVTLRVEPGVEVRTDANMGIIVHGVINATGTADAPILFTASVKQPNGWNGLYISSEADSAAILQHVVMEYGGMPNLTFGMLHDFGGGMTVRNSVFRNAGHSGITTTMSDRVEIVDTRFVDNGGPALIIYSIPATDGLLQNLQATGNGTNAIVVNNARFEGTHTLERAGLPYIVQDALVIDDSAQVTVAPGVEFQSDGIFVVNGRLIAEGTTAQPITFRGVAATPGSWEGISFDGIADDAGNLPVSSLRYVVVEHGGTVEQNNAGGVYGASVTMRNAVVTLSNSVIRDGGNYGIAGRGGVGSNRFTISDTTISGHPSYALMFENGTANPVLRNIAASGNGVDGVGVRGSLTGSHVWERLAIPYVVAQGVDVAQGSTLTIQPGTTVQMAQEQGLTVYGRLNAVGTAETPITFTGTTESAGWWRHLYITGEAVLQYCDIGYGGSGSTNAMVQTELESSAAVIQRCRIHHSASAGIGVDGIIPPVIDHNRIESNALGVINMLFEEQDVDARNNWWGDASGPFHPTLNPQGKGNAVDDNVLFDPWLRSPSEGGQGGLLVSVGGPGRFTPGSTQDYAIAYSNTTPNAVENAVLMVALPDNAEYVDNSGGGTFWPQRHQVFWKLGTLAPNTTGIVSVRVRYFWGLPEGLMDSTQAFLGGSNVAATEFDVQSYLDYRSISVTGEQPLSAAQLSAEQQAYPDLRQLYSEAVEDGFVLGTANSVSLSNGASMTEIVMLRFKPDFAMQTLWRQGTRVVARTVDRSNYVVRNPRGAVRFSVQTGAWETVGNASMVSADAARPTASFGDCMTNCVIELVPPHVVKNVIKGASTVSKAVNCIKAASGDELSIPKCAQIIKKIPGVSEGIDLGKCNSDCQRDPNSHVCTEDKRVCEGYPFSFFAAAQSITVYQCDTDTGRYRAGRTEKVCAQCEKCIEGVNGAQCVNNQGLLPFHALLDPARGLSRPSQANVAAGPRIAAAAPAPTQTGSFARAQFEVRPQVSDGECEECRVAKDPNAKIGVEGDAVPGQLLTYTVEYENVGAGEAFGVFIVDRLGEHFDAATLQLNDGGEYSAAARMITWDIGQLAPRGQAGSKGSVSFSVRLESGLPSGTVITNQAVVHFPSVPEETPTNTVVNVVQPLVAVPQRVEVEAGKTLALVLSGRDAANTPLRFTVVEEPLYGTLSGTAPNLVYTPRPNFTGMDHVRFVVGNGTSTSRPADIEIRVLPSANDKTAPRVAWTEPGAGQTILADRAPRFSDSQGTLYAPMIQIGFDEALQASSVGDATVRLADANGRAVPVQVSYDASADQVIVLSREPLRAGTTYTVTLTRGIRDASGNALAEDYRWSFETAGMHMTFLPLVRR